MSSPFETMIRNFINKPPSHTFSSMLILADRGLDLNLVGALSRSIFCLPGEYETKWSLCAYELLLVGTDPLSIVLFTAR